MKSTLRQFTLLIAITLVHVSPGLTANFNDLLDRAKKSVSGGSSISNDEIVHGLKEALEVGTQNTVSTVSKPDGYFKEIHTVHAVHST